MKKITVASSQYGYVFGRNQIHLPYSIATLVSFCKSITEIDEQCLFSPICFFRDDVETHIKECSKADVLLCSCYCWNWEITNYLARSVKSNNPNCLVVFGGPEVPSLDSNFFRDHSYVDIIVHDEGEVPLSNILLSFLRKESLTCIAGTETKLAKSPPQTRISDLDTIPSPYSTGLMWDLVDRNSDFKFTASWETNRGCPFQCTFCDWGSNTKSKIRCFSEEKLFKEIEWFAENKIVYIDICDGNFGIFADRDFRIAEKLVNVKQKTGSDFQCGITWVKTSSEKIIPLAKKLTEASLLRAVSLSVQSFDKSVLKIIKRSNIKFDVFSDLVKRFDDENLQTYTELIMGLPGETFESFKSNWNTLASVYPSPAIMVWNCSVFNNAEMNIDSYRKEHGIEVFSSPLFMQHSLRRKIDPIPEFERMIRRTKSLPGDDIIEVYMYNWMMMVFHAFGILEFVSRYCALHDVAYSQFYDELLKFLQISPSICGKEYEKALVHAKLGYSGNGWDHHDSAIGDINWPIEEASWLRLSFNKEIVKENMLDFGKIICDKFNLNNNEINDLINFQSFLLNSPQDTDVTTETFEYDWKEYFENHTLSKTETTYTKISKVKALDHIQWCYETMWFGRRHQSCKTKIKELKEVL